MAINRILEGGVKNMGGIGVGGMIMIIKGVQRYRIRQRQVLERLVVEAKNRWAEVGLKERVTLWNGLSMLYEEEKSLASLVSDEEISKVLKDPSVFWSLKMKALWTAILHNRSAFSNEL
jgi:hypothetical protein